MKEHKDQIRRNAVQILVMILKNFFKTDHVKIVHLIQDNKVMENLVDQIIVM